MKKPLLIVLTLAMLFSLCACGSGESNAPEIKPEEAIIGKWDYALTFSDFHFVFNSDGNVKHWSNNNESKYDKYTIDGDKIIIDNLADEWDIRYKIENGMFEVYLIEEDGDISTFSKDESYDPEAITTLELTEEMVDEIEEKINDSKFKLVVLTYETMAFKGDKDLTFTDLDITNQKKTSQYEYTAFGVIYAKDNYGEKYRQNVNITFTVEEDQEEESGYSIKWVLEFVE